MSWQSWWNLRFEEQSNYINLTLKKNPTLFFNLAAMKRGVLISCNSKRWIDVPWNASTITLLSGVKSSEGKAPSFKNPGTILPREVLME